MDPTPIDATDETPPVSDPERVAEVCARWAADREDRSEGTWTGSTERCDPGELSPEGIDNTLRLVNLYRWLGGLPATAVEAQKTEAAQACALMLEANFALSHDPPKTWACYTAEGAVGAATSNIAGLPSVSAVELYMPDAGNAETLGHRRWILSNRLDSIGIGSTQNFSCLAVVGNGDAGVAWTAWPPPGPAPLDLFGRAGNLDATGWSVQSDEVDLSTADVRVRRDGIDLPVRVAALLPNFGSSSAVSFVPEGWETRPGFYRVTLSGVETPIAYDVEVVDCPDS